MESYFATKTAYVHNANLDTTPLTMDTCQPLVFYLVARLVY